MTSNPNRELQTPSGEIAQCPNCLGDVQTMRVLKYHQTRSGRWCVGSGGNVDAPPASPPGERPREERLVEALREIADIRELFPYGPKVRDEMLRRAQRIAVDALASPPDERPHEIALKHDTPCARCGHRFDRHLTEPDIEINYLTCADCEPCEGFAIALASERAREGKG